MESINFLIKKLEELYSTLSYLEIKYEYRKSISTHIIEVKPVHCYEGDKQYVLKQIALEEDFERNFPNEEVLFMTENVLIQIESPILELGISKIAEETQVISFEILDNIPSKQSAEFYDNLFMYLKDNIESHLPYIQCLPIEVTTNINNFYEIKVDNKGFKNSLLQNLTEHFKSKKEKKSNTKKDPEINQGLFFLV